MTNAEIQVGEYVRTIDGKIYKTDGDKLRMNNAKTILFKEIRKIPCDYIPYKVKNHSFDIIDLIEVGDYVNGDRVIKKYNDCLMVGTAFINQWIPNELVETIVTKEQFKAMEYEVGEND